MSFFTPQTKVVKIDDENSVVVRKLTYGERQTVIDLATKVGADMTANVQVGVMKSQLLYHAVLSWDGPGFDGRPVTPENIGALPPEVADMIAAGADALTSGLTDEEKKASAAP